MRTQIPHLASFITPFDGGEREGQATLFRGLCDPGAREELVLDGSTHFVAIGQMHALGPEGILKQLLRIG